MQKRRKAPRRESLRQLKKQALRLAGGYVKEIRVNPFTKAYVYLCWDSDTFLDGFWLGYAFTEKIPAKVKNYVLDRWLWEEIQDKAKEVIDEEVECSNIELLCRKADEAFYQKNPDASKQEYLDFEATFLHTLDEETKETRDSLVNKAHDRIKKMGGKTYFERWT